MSSLHTTITAIEELMRELPAADTADLFMSPHAHENLLLTATKEEGPAMWMVNRSDILNVTLEILSRHSIPGIAERAVHKLALRTNPPIDLPEALDPESIDLETIPNHEVEEILGHPEVPLRQIAKLIKSQNNDFRASTALSFARRILEFPVIKKESSLLAELNNTFERLLLSDESNFVRSYIARIPTLSENCLIEALKKEKNPQVTSRLLQHPNLKFEDILDVLNFQKEQLDPVIETVLAIDKRFPTPLRSATLDLNQSSELALHFHAFALGTD